MSTDFSTNEPDTIIVETKHVKGFGATGTCLTVIRDKSTRSLEWQDVMPNVKGIPENLDRAMYSTYQIDYMQTKYQAYYQGKISKHSLENTIADYSDIHLLSKNELKVDVAISAGLDKNGRTIVLIDKNYNRDFSDEKPIVILPKVYGQEFNMRYNDSLLVDIQYEYFNGEEIQNKSTWLYIDYSIFQKPQDTGTIELLIGTAEHRIGKFKVDNKEYTIGLFAGNRRGIYRKDYYILNLTNQKTKLIKSKYEIGKDEILIVDNLYYRFVKASADGQYITLVKDDSARYKGGTRIGLKAVDFKAKTINNKDISLQDYKGKYIYLFFWGKYCPHCLAEIPKLKDLYKKYNKSFTILGVVDDIDNPKNYITSK